MGKNERGFLNGGVILLFVLAMLVITIHYFDYTNLSELGSTYILGFYYLLNRIQMRSEVIML